MFNNRRLVGLDAWRTVLLVLGVCIHAANDPHGWEQWFSVVTHKFRMEAFFAISGLLAAFTLPGQAWTTWLARRWITLGVPALVVLLVLNMPATTLVALGDQRRLGQAITMPAIRMPIFHLWFLFVLLACTTMLALVRARPRLQARINQAVQSFCDARLCKPQWMLIAMVCIAALTTSLLEQAYLDINTAINPENRFVQLAMLNFGRTGARVPYYFVFYFLGWMIGTRPCFARICLNHRSTLYFLVASGILVIAVTYHYLGDYVFPYEGQNSLAGGRTFGWISKALISVPATLLVLSHAVSIKRVPSFVARFSAASYTIYLVHYFILSVLWMGLGPIGWGTTERYVFTVTAALALGYVFHFRLVSSYPVLAWLLNGKGRLQDVFPPAQSRRPIGLTTA